MVRGPARKVSGIRSKLPHVALVAILLFIAAGVIAVDANARGCKSYRCQERVAIRHCNQARPRWCVERAIITYRLNGWQAAWMRRVYICESGGNPYAVNPSGSVGLWQFQPSTMRSTKYGSHSPFSAKWSSLAAAWMLVNGRSGEWVCR